MAVHPIDGLVRARARLEPAKAAAPAAERVLVPYQSGPNGGAFAVDQTIIRRPPPPKRPILLYNENCETCKVLSDWVKAQDLKGEDRIDERPLPNDPSQLKALNPNIDIWDAYEKIHLLMPDGEIKVGGDAIAELFKNLPATRWAGPLLNTRAAKAVISAGYTALDALRPALGCSSCGGGPVAWWAKPVQWGAQSLRTWFS